MDKTVWPLVVPAWAVGDGRMVRRDGLVLTLTRADNDARDEWVCADPDGSPDPGSDLCWLVQVPIPGATPGEAIAMEVAQLPPTDPDGAMVQANRIWPCPGWRSSNDSFREAWATADPAPSKMVVDDPPDDVKPFLGTSPGAHRWLASGRCDNTGCTSIRGINGHVDCPAELA